MVADSNRDGQPGARPNLAVVDTAKALAGKPALLGYAPVGPAAPAVRGRLAQHHAAGHQHQVGPAADAEPEPPALTAAIKVTSMVDEPPPVTRVLATADGRQLEVLSTGPEDGLVAALPQRHPRRAGGVPGHGRGGRGARAAHRDVRPARLRRLDRAAGPPHRGCGGRRRGGAGRARRPAVRDRRLVRRRAARTGLRGAAARPLPGRRLAGRRGPAPGRGPGLDGRDGPGERRRVHRGRAGRGRAHRVPGGGRGRSRPGHRRSRWRRRWAA